MEIAVLITSHNRKDKTINCLDCLFKSFNKDNLYLDIFLVDDGSTDGTSELIIRKYPKINLINGDGNLYWNQGMRLAWKKAIKNKDYDFYLWLNDDTFLDDNSLIHMFECYDEAKLLNGKSNLIVGTCRNDKKNNISYGLSNENGIIIPNGKLQKGKYINGNCVLVSKEIFKKNGILSKYYSHAFGDIDYGLRVLENGNDIYTTKKIIATCLKNINVPACFDKSFSIIDRFKHLNSKKGHSIKEVIYFRKRFWGWKWIIFLFKLLLRVIFPKQYNMLKKFYEG